MLQMLQIITIINYYREKKKKKKFLLAGSFENIKKSVTSVTESLKLNDSKGFGCYRFFKHL